VKKSSGSLFSSTRRRCLSATVLCFRDPSALTRHLMAGSAANDFRSTTRYPIPDTDMTHVGPSSYCAEAARIDPVPNAASSAAIPASCIVGNRCPYTS
jgi:hypothetical protein